MSFTLGVLYYIHYYHFLSLFSCLMSGNFFSSAGDKADFDRNDKLPLKVVDFCWTSEELIS